MCARRMSAARGCHLYFARGMTFPSCADRMRPHNEGKAAQNASPHLARSGSDHFDSHLDVVSGGPGVGANFVMGFGDESLGSGAVHAINMCLQVTARPYPVASLTCNVASAFTAILPVFTFSRKAAYSTEPPKQAEYPAAKNCSGLLAPSLPGPPMTFGIDRSAFSSLRHVALASARRAENPSRNQRYGGGEYACCG
jgi:hypothetical protein